MRLDQALVAAGFADSRTRAQAMIAAGVVLLDGQIAAKPSAPVGDKTLSVTAPQDKWVSRAAHKLRAAIDAFDLDVAGCTAVDIGASTGGFTQVLLNQNVDSVLAIDVGHGQLHPSLQSDPRVTSLERTNIRDLDVSLVKDADLLVCDLSFISITKALPHLLGAVRSGCQMICLVKPQFEVGPERIGKGGIVRDPAARDDAVNNARNFFERNNWSVLGLIDSPIKGGDGNTEYLLQSRKL